MLMPGVISSVAMACIAGAVMMRRGMRMGCSVTSRSSWALRKLKRMAGGLVGVLDAMWMLPVLSERRMFMMAVMPEVFASLKLAPARKGIQEMAASGASRPARVRT